MILQTEIYVTSYLCTIFSYFITQKIILAAVSDDPDQSCTLTITQNYSSFHQQRLLADDFLSPVLSPPPSLPSLCPSNGYRNDWPCSPFHGGGTHWTPKVGMTPLASARAACPSNRQPAVAMDCAALQEESSK